MKMKKIPTLPYKPTLIYLNIPTLKYPKIPTLQTSQGAVYLPFL